MSIIPKNEINVYITLTIKSVKIRYYPLIIIIRTESIIEPINVSVPDLFGLIVSSFTSSTNIN